MRIFSQPTVFWVKENNKRSCRQKGLASSKRIPGLRMASAAFFPPLQKQGEPPTWRRCYTVVIVFVFFLMCLPPCPFCFFPSNPVHTPPISGKISLCTEGYEKSNLFLRVRISAHIHQNNHTHEFMLALLVILSNWKQLMCPSTEKHG